MKFSEYQKLASRTDLSDEGYLNSRLSQDCPERARAIAIVEQIHQLATELDPLKKALLYKSKEVFLDSDTKDIETMRYWHGILGVLTEIPELIDAAGKNDVVNIGEEIADQFWYLALIANNYNLNMDNTAEANIAKLKKRFPGKFTTEDANNRDLTAERAILEDNTLKPAKSNVLQFPEEAQMPNWEEDVKAKYLKFAATLIIIMIAFVSAIAAPLVLSHLF